MRVTIKDIAEQADVSITTVSLVLNNRPNNISEATKQRIYGVAEGLNYRPNTMAVGLATKKTKTIGLVVPDISNLFFSGLAKSIENTLSKYQYSVILTNSNNSIKESIKSVQLLLNRGVDGLIVSFASSHEDSEEDFAHLLDTLNNSTVPLISVDSWLDGLKCPRVSIDHLHGGYLATKHLLELGHQKIGCITGKKGNFTSDERLKGYVQALEEYNIDYVQKYVIEGDYKFETGYNCAKKLLKTDITALFVTNDLMAYGAYLAVKDANIKIPNDISIVGFDDLFFSKMLSVPLTTVHQSTKDLGEKATDMLMDLINEVDIENRLINEKPYLVIRESTNKQ